MTPPRTSVWKLPAASGALYVLAFYSGTLLPNLVMFLPILLWLDIEREAPRLRRMWAGFTFGVVAYLPGLHFHYAMAEISWLAWVLYAGLVVVFGLKCSLTFALLGWLRRRSAVSFGVLVPVVWIAVEWLATWGDLKMTADHSGHSLAGFPRLVQFADLFGTYGVGLALCAWNGLLYELLYGFYARTRRRAAIALLVLGAAVIAYNQVAWNGQESALAARPTVRMAFVQPNIPLQVKHATHTEAEQWRVLERLTRSAAASGAKVVVWPESSWPWTLWHWIGHPETHVIREVQSLARELEVSIVVGAEYARVESEERFDFFNAALLVHADGRLDEAWGGKIYLVPFTEGVPLRPLLGPLVEDLGGEWRWAAGGFTPAPSWALLPLRADSGEVLLGVQVCYEQLFYEPSRWLRNRGASVQAVITNDAWFGRTPFQSLQRNVLRMRAIENRTSMLRVANTGFSGFVDPLGRYSETTGLFEEAVGVKDVAIGGPTTLYARTGNAAAWMAVACLLALVVRSRSSGR